MLKTEIKELDNLLGHEDISPGSIIIIKGGPGSGKTTLGLQILNNNLKKYGPGQQNKEFHAGFLSLELPYAKPLDYVRSKYNFNELITENENFFPASKQDIKEKVESYFKKKKKDRPRDFIADIFKNCLKNKKDSTIGANRSIIFVDSLNLLIDIIQHASKEISFRDIIHEICEVAVSGLNDNHTKPVYIFSVEHHPSMFESKIYISESFICDTEILLTIEPIKETSLKPKSLISGVGYEIEVDKEGKKAYEYRSFCRIIKSRYSKNDSRRCSYDIKNGKGIVFYETFPGDGQIYLFYENDKQDEVWKEFYKDDIPHHYPSLRYDTFNRKNLQQTFSTQRRAKYIPEKTDLYLTSLDNYWVHWYVDLWRKTNIREIIENHHVFEDYIKIIKQYKGYDILNLVVNQIHSIFTTHKFDMAQFFPKKGNILNNIAIINGDPFFRLQIKNSKLSVSKKQTGKPTDLTPYIYCIKKATKITFIDMEGYNDYIDTPGNIHIIGNTKGMIIQCVHENNKKILKTIVTNHSHIQINVIQEIEVVSNSTPNQQTNPKQTENYQSLIFDIQNGLTYKKKKYGTEEPIDKKEENPNPDKVSNIIAIIDGKITASLNVVNNCAANIIETMVREKFEDSLQGLLINLSSDKNLKCISCNYYRFLLQEFCKGNEIIDVEIPEIFKSIEKIKKPEEISFTDFIDELNKRLVQIDRSLNNQKNRQEEILYTLLLELSTKKWIECQYSEKNPNEPESSLKNRIIENIKHYKKIGNKPACNWEKLFDESTSAFNNKMLEEIKDLISKSLFNLSITSNDKNQALMEILKQVFSLEYSHIKKVCRKKLGNSNFNAFHTKLNIVNDEMIIMFLISLLRQDSSRNILVPLKKDELRLFGEKKSEIIKELKNYNFSNNRPIHHQDFIFSLRNYEEFISVPYDANISFIVNNKSALIKFYNVIRKDGNKNPVKLEYIRLVKEIYTNKKRALQNAVNLKLNNLNKKNEVKLNNLINRSILLNHPSTWEEIIALFLMIRSDEYKNILIEEEFNKELFLIETQTYDTFLCTFLEILWNSGGDLYTSPDYLIKGREKIQRSLLHALYLFGYLFYTGIFPENSTLDVSLFTEESPNKDKWLFARHWYSTFIDILTTKRTDLQSQKTQEFLWNDNIKSSLDIMPVPVSLDQYMRSHNPMEVRHYSCWGDWHFAVIRGSENLSLGIELINKLMSSRNIEDRASKCANLPTTQEFYEMYGKNRCIDLPDRKDNNNLPDITYNQLRNMLFKNAKSRSQIFDYRHYMRELHAVLKYTEYISVRDKLPRTETTTYYPEYLLSDIKHKLDQAVEEMLKFPEKELQMY